MVSLAGFLMGRVPIVNMRPDIVLLLNQVFCFLYAFQESCLARFLCLRLESCLGCFCGVMIGITFQFVLQGGGGHS